MTEGCMHVQQHAVTKADAHTDVYRSYVIAADVATTASSVVHAAWK
jgi:hypothetical protein